MNFTKLLNSKLNILELSAIQDASGQVFNTWTPTVTDVPCRKDIAPKDYQITTGTYANTVEKYIFFINSSYSNSITKNNRILCKEVEYIITDIMRFDSISGVHHIEIYAVKSEFGVGGGFSDLSDFSVDPNQFVKKTQRVNDKVLTGDIVIGITDIPSLQGELTSIQAELDSKQDIAINYDDKTYQQAFTAQASVTVTHNLSKYPVVTIIESTGDEIIGGIQHISINQFVVTFSGATGGIIYCN